MELPSARSLVQTQEHFFIVISGPTSGRSLVLIQQLFEIAVVVIYTK